MIELKNVTRRYRQGENGVVALNNVSLRIEASEFVAVTGESGSGKSTFLHLVGALDKPDSGEVVVDGLALQSASEQQLTAYRARKLGIVFQFFNLLPTLNVLENVCVPLRFQRVKRGEAVMRAREMQRVAIARALIHRPAVLLADEPTGNLDSANAAKVMEIFQTIGDQRLATLVVVTHNLEFAEEAGRRIVLRDGKVV